VTCSRVLTAVFREADVVARFGGDEFAVLAVDCSELDTPVVTERLDAALAEHNAADGEPFSLSMSVGAAGHVPCDAVDIDKLMATADSRMYEQKRNSGRARSSDSYQKADSQPVATTNTSSVRGARRSG
jgi:diguanylate cyclase (GGDEF)-like protein